MSEAHSRFGPGGLKSRWTRSSATRTPGTLKVVRNLRRFTYPDIPAARISRSTRLRPSRTPSSRRVYLDLRDEGVRLGRKRVERLMRAAGMSGYVKRRKFRTTFSVPGVRVADDLVQRDFNPPGPNRLWASDIKYVSTWEGTLYLASVIDCFSRKVVGWSMRADMQAELVVDALEMAISRRQPADELVHHSDQGTQYIALIFGQKLRKAGIAQSMGSKGDCYDNAVCESFHA